MSETKVRMSKGRQIGEVVLLNGDEEGSYLGRIDALGTERKDVCPRCFMDPTHDQHCREWSNIEILDVNRKPTGQFVYHVAEYAMSDPA